MLFVKSDKVTNKKKSLTKIPRRFLYFFHPVLYTFSAVIELLCGMELCQAQVTVTKQLYIYTHVNSKMK
jgi:hypothetical protein